MIFATRAVHCSANDVTEGFSHSITERIHTILCAGSEVIRLYNFEFVERLNFSIIDDVYLK